VHQCVDGLASYAWGNRVQWILEHSSLQPFYRCFNAVALTRPKQTWSITFEGARGVIGTVDTLESQFVIGTEAGSNVFTVHCKGAAKRHAWIWVNGAGLQVEDLGGGTRVNG
jgi:hypothetical protein